MKSLLWWYTRVIGIFFVFVSIALVMDIAVFGIRAETFHKIFHVTYGIWIIGYLWPRKPLWRVFAYGNGIFFLTLSSIGIIFPDLGGLDAFIRPARR
jgi:hypothetical protein